MNFNGQEIVKELSFGTNASSKIFSGIDKLNRAVSSTLGASGRCVILENNFGEPVITKDGVTVASSIILQEPLENIGATLIKEASRKTVREAGDGTTTATVLAHAIIKEAMAFETHDSRTLTNEMKVAVDKALKYLDEISIPVKGDMIRQVATISANNDTDLGNIIGEAFEKVGKDGVVIMETSDTAETTVEIVDGLQLERGIKTPHFITNIERQVAELNNPLVLLVESNIPNIRKIQNVLEFAIKSNRSILIIGDVEPQVLSALAMNNVKGNIKVNVIDAPDYGVMRREQLSDIAALTGATIINEDLGDDIDLITPEHLGECIKSVTDATSTTLTVDPDKEAVKEQLENVKNQMAKEVNPGRIGRLERRLAMLSCSVGIVRVGANSDIELKEKKDRVDDAIHATKAAIKEGIIPGGGVALYNFSYDLALGTDGEKLIAKAIRAPFNTVLRNAGLYKEYVLCFNGNEGINAITGECVDMLKEGIIDPVLVTKSALTNAFSVAITILSTDCVINNVRKND
jgi:chaperonin GroEL